MATLSADRYVSLVVVGGDVPAAVCSREHKGLVDQASVYCHAYAAHMPRIGA